MTMKKEKKIAIVVSEFQGLIIKGIFKFRKGFMGNIGISNFCNQQIKAHVLFAREGAEGISMCVTPLSTEVGVVSPIVQMKQPRFREANDWSEVTQLARRSPSLSQGIWP